MPDKITHILNDRESGSVALLNRLINALEEILLASDLNAEQYIRLLITVREKLNHFAAIENFLASLIKHTGQEADFPGESLRFIADYRLYWNDSAKKIADNFLQLCNPGGLRILTHSHSETVISLLYQLHARQIPFRILQTVSCPGEEGRKSYGRMRQKKIQAELIDDIHIKDIISRIDIILMGCDALLAGKFLNKVGTRTILEQAKLYDKRTFLVTESRKEINRPEWESEMTHQALFEWVPLNLIGRIVTEK